VTQAEYGTPTEYITDLIRMVTQAGRRGRGDLVWMGWQPGGADREPKDPRRLNFGSQLICVTPRGAAELQRCMPVRPGTVRTAEEEAACASSDLMEMGHWDAQLKWALHRDAGRTRLGRMACYTSPPVGNFRTHPSDCDAAFGGERLHMWGRFWCTAGTRPSHTGASNRRRELCAFGGHKGKAIHVGWLELEQNASSRNWLSRWVGSGPRPDVAHATPPPTSSSRGLSLPPPSWHPAASPADPSAAGAVPPSSTEPTGRGRRQRRQQKLLNAFRCWVDGDDVPPSKKKRGCVGFPRGKLTRAMLDVSVAARARLQACRPPNRPVPAGVAHPPAAAAAPPPLAFPTSGVSLRPQPVICHGRSRPV
jgi:hypothetical protein